MLFSELVFSTTCPRHRFLEEMENSIPWEWFDKQLRNAIHLKTGGRPPYPRVFLFRMHLLQVWFGLSDAETEFQCHDRLSFRKFLGVNQEGPIPDATTLENFRHELEKTGIGKKLITRLDQWFQEQGLILKEGNLVDATFIQANSRPKKDPDTQSDLDAEHGHKGFGYSATTNVDQVSKLIRHVVVAGNAAHDVKHLEPVLIGDEQVLYGDSGYVGREKMLKARGIVPKICQRRKRGKQGEPTPALSVEAKAYNKAVSQIRSRVEHPFACWKVVFKVKRAWYRGLERVSQQVYSLTLAYNLRRLGFLLRGALQ
jgi:IS5 family transposase